MAKRAAKVTVKKGRGGQNKKPLKAPADRRPQKGRNTTGLVPFAKGNSGRKKGIPNKFTLKLKDAIMQAAEMSGRNGKGKDGAVGYLVWLSRAEPAVFGRMLEKVMPLQIDVKDKTDHRMNAQEAVERLKERGLPIPPALLSLAEAVGRAVVHAQERDDDEALDAEGIDVDSIDDDADEETEDEESARDDNEKGSGDA